MTDYEPKIGDIGTKILITIVDQDSVVIDLSSSTAKNIRFRKPDGTTVIKTATFETDGTDGKIYYISETDFWDLAGSWTYEGHVIFPTTEWTTSDEETITVKARVID